MTVTEILERLRPVKPMSRQTLYANLRRLRIKPIGARQIPQLYPHDTADKILKRLGLTNGRAGTHRKQKGCR